jgi:hypothetical protein
MSSGEVQGKPNQGLHYPLRREGYNYIMSSMQSIAFVDLKVNFRKYPFLNDIVHLSIEYGFNLSKLNDILILGTARRHNSGLENKQFKLFISDLNYIFTLNGFRPMILKSVKYPPTKKLLGCLKMEVNFKIGFEREPILLKVQPEYNIDIYRDSMIFVPPERKGLKNFYEKKGRVVSKSEIEEATTAWDYSRLVKDMKPGLDKTKYLLKEEVAELKAKEDKIQSELRQMEEEIITQNIIFDEKPLWGRPDPRLAQYKTYLEATRKYDLTEDNIKNRILEDLSSCIESSDICEKVIEWGEVAASTNVMPDFGFISHLGPFSLEKMRSTMPYMVYIREKFDDEFKAKLRSTIEKKEKALSELRKFKLHKSKTEYLKGIGYDKKAKEAGELRKQLLANDTRYNIEFELMMMKDRLKEIRDSKIKRKDKFVKRAFTRELSFDEVFPLQNKFSALENECEVLEGGYDSEGDSIYFVDSEEGEQQVNLSSIKVDPKTLGETLYMFSEVENFEDLFCIDPSKYDSGRAGNSIPRMRGRCLVALAAKLMQLIKNGKYRKNVDKSIHHVRGCSVKFLAGNITRYIVGPDHLQYIKNDNSKKFFLRTYGYRTRSAVSEILKVKELKTVEFKSIGF